MCSLCNSGEADRQDLFLRNFLVSLRLSQLGGEELVPGSGAEGVFWWRRLAFRYPRRRSVQVLTCGHDEYVVVHTVPFRVIDAGEGYAPFWFATNPMETELPESGARVPSQVR